MRARWIAVLFISLSIFVCTSTALNACEATTFITNAGNAMMGAARNGSPRAFSGVASRYTDLNDIAMFALGPNRGSMSDAQKAEYVALTRGFIGRFMARHASKFSGSGLKITGCSGTKNTLIVNTQLSGGKKIIFKLYRTRRGYLVRDVNVSSVWLAQQLRSTFVGVMRRNHGNFAALFKYLRT